MLLCCDQEENLSPDIAWLMAIKGKSEVIIVWDQVLAEIVYILQNKLYHNRMVLLPQDLRCSLWNQGKSWCWELYISHLPDTRPLPLFYILLRQWHESPYFLVGEVFLCGWWSRALSLVEEKCVVLLSSQGSLLRPKVGATLCQLESMFSSNSPLLSGDRRSNIKRFFFSLNQLGKAYSLQAIARSI